MTFKKFARFTSFAVLGLLSAKAVLAGRKGRAFKDIDARRAVEAANARFRLAVQAGRAEEIAALYEEDASLLPPNQDIITGRPGIRAFWQAGLDSGIEDALLASLEIGIHDEVITETGVYTMRIQQAGKPGMEDSGKYVVIWKRQPDGSVRLETDIWNSNLPVRR
jgi:ketosteroid isomerase-like protein